MRIFKVRLLSIQLLLVMLNCDLSDSYDIERYGTEWMYFPDGQNIPRVIDLSQSVPIFTSRMKRNVEFRLYTKKNMRKYIVLSNVLEGEDFKLKEIINNNSLIKVITHGWMSTANMTGVMDIVDAYMQARTDVIVISVDWSAYAMNYFYVSVANQIKEVGIRVAEFLNSTYDTFNISGDQIHLIGHSLGAHVMGIAGSESKFKVGRITGLDPALPMFKSIQDNKSRLDHDDAKFVDVIHTCGGVLGFWDAIGTADFYPNNGMAPQPGCMGLNVFQFEACSHGRAIVYFSESILNPNAFPSYQCNGWNYNMEQNCQMVGYMGEHVNMNMSGIAYLQTNSEKPFGKGLIKSSK